MIKVTDYTLAREYLSGSTIPTLVEKYDLPRETVRRRLIKYGVQLRPRGTPGGGAYTACKAAVQAYDQGASARSLAIYYDVRRSTMRLGLIRAGVNLRPRGVGGGQSARLP